RESQRAAWESVVDRTREELSALIPPEDAFILADQGDWGSGLFADNRTVFPYVERDGQYWGPPGDDEVAIQEFDRLRQAGARFMAFAEPAFWWLEYYSAFADYLRARFPCVLENERLVVFDLCPSVSKEPAGATMATAASASPQ